MKLPAAELEGWSFIVEMPSLSDHVMERLLMVATSVLHRWRGFAHRNRCGGANGARIGKHCLVTVGTLVTEGKSFPDGSLIVGSPAVVKRELSPKQIDGLLDRRHYRENAHRYRETLIVQRP